MNSIKTKLYLNIILFLIILKPKNSNPSEKFGMDKSIMNLQVHQRADAKISQGLIKHQIVNFNFTNDKISKEETWKEIQNFIISRKLEITISSILLIYLLIAKYINNKAKSILKKNTYDSLKFTNIEEIEELLKKNKKEESLTFLRKRFLNIEKLKKLIVKINIYFEKNLTNNFFTFLPFIFKESKILEKNKIILKNKIKLLLDLISNIS